MSDTTRNAVSLDTVDQLALAWAFVFAEDQLAHAWTSVFAEDQLAHAWTAVRAADHAGLPLTSVVPQTPLGLLAPTTPLGLLAPMTPVVPFVSFASIYAKQLRMKRELDHMFEQVDDMQVKLDDLVVEVAALKKRRL